MSTSLLTAAADEGLAAIRRLRVALWPITQSSVAAGLAWYLTYDLLDHPQPFFAPISAVVCMSATSVLRARRAAQMIVGVALGIVLGAGVNGVLGSGEVAMAVVVFVALSIAVLSARGVIAQGLMFVNQTAVSAVLVLVFAGNGGVVAERLFDSLIGGGIALVFAILLFPADPLALLREARAAALAAAHDTLTDLANTMSDPPSAPADWAMAAVDRLHRQVGELIEVRATAALVVRRAPRRWRLRGAMRDINEQVEHVGLLVGSLLHLVRMITRPDRGEISEPVRCVLSDLTAGVGLVDADPAAATARMAAACRHISALRSVARDPDEVVLADIVRVCVNDLERVIEHRV
ncbi:FUSC family protein [Mycobacterium spongiae]|uniref:Aromatic acid exporter family protein n=1 Tax=Mycobacterium spongiae TaxID=886343 RepID=A0A975PWG8_9MYCO|nr:FUSC family protein [Mycobacterium spongiae]QUR67196.1 aromatic acid exporter family protein [Mycobacterium spongiae]